MSTNRCKGFTKTGKKCRSRIDNGIFCKTHLPFNHNDMATCFNCCENISNSKDIIVLKCNHFFHKPCLNNWLDHSEDYKCPLCRTEIKVNFSKNKKFEHSFLNLKNSVTIMSL